MTAPELLVAAKVSLAQIQNNAGKYQESIDLLIKDPHSVVTAISVPDEAKRPESGVQRREFASLAAQLLLRARIGSGNSTRHRRQWSCSRRSRERPRARR
ncbi:MAG: hypothetical protein CM1200mP2_45050 [Planctomycetaceae bacterium]|nr:MAG: hypothetical protein CM1200mP2_45050 [Planctomycetaceae bacterium]